MQYTRKLQRNTIYTHCRSSTEIYLPCPLTSADFYPPSSPVTTKRTSEPRSNPTGTDIDPHSVKMYHWLFLNVEDGAWPYVVKGMGIKISADGCFSAAEALR